MAPAVRGPVVGATVIVMSVPLQNLRRALDQGAAVSSQFARAWIVDEDRVPVGCDGERSRFLVKL